METLQELYEESVKDVYSAEKQFLKAMPRLLKAARNESLKAAIEAHITQSEGHVDRLEKIGELGGFKLSGVVCKAAQGLVEEVKEHLEDGEPGPVLDAAIVACAQKNEYYEIATYGTIIAWATELGEKEHVALLEEILAEEEAADDLLTNVATKEVNKAARSEEIGNRAPRPKRATVK